MVMMSSDTKIRVKKWVENESSVSVPSANVEGAGPPGAFP